MRLLRLALLATCWMSCLARPSPGADPEMLKRDEQALKAEKIATDGPGLLEFFRKQILDENEKQAIGDLIRKLGDDLFAVREKASLELVQRGPAAAVLLRQATHDIDVEIVRRAERCLEQIDRAPNAALAMAAARLVGDRKPEGAAEVLLAYAPFAEDETVLEQVRAALALVALVDGQPAPVLVEALDDTDALRRGTAADALIRGGASADVLQAAHRLLRDPDADVRLRVALAMIDTRHKEAIPVLIALLADLPQTAGWQAEEVLYQIAGDKAPDASLGRTEADRRRCRDAWLAWWRANGDGVDLSQHDPTQRMLGLTLIVQMDNGRVTGRVMELGPDGKPRWEIANLQYPLDAQVLPGNRVLIAEYRSNHVTERNFKGEILWQKQINQPINCQRLPNGNTFIVARNQVIEVDRGGRTVFTHNRPGFDLMAAQKLRNGQMILVTNTGQCIRLDATGKQVQTFNAGRVSTFSSIDVLPSGRILIPEISANRVAEYDASGKLVWQAPVTSPTSVMRLPNGNTLVASMNNQRVLEINRSGTVTWEHKVDGRPWRAARR